ncbi:MAG TPA: type 1 glutamine amidotransferase domain-containing protein [Gammaproteobacteria bacterium]|nr:type 1 glutamine amidotransferase domain-containing protein [Gammaproteobacteria bacterium]
MSNKILFVVTGHARLGDTGKETGYFLSEVSHPHKTFVDAGLEVTFITPKGGKPPMDPRSYNTDDPDNKEFLENDDWQQRFADMRRPAEVNAAEYDAIFFAGGHGAMWDFPDNPDLAELTRSVYEHGGVVSAVCHGPAALLDVRLADGRLLIEGKEVASFTNEEEQAVGLAEVVPFLLQTRLEERGARHKHADKFQTCVVTDGRLVTGQNPASARDVGEAVVKLLK